jgi:hypothetical protein
VGLQTSVSGPVHAAQDPSGIVVSFENFYAPQGYLDCPSGLAVVTRVDQLPFVEFDNFSLTVSNSKNKILGTSYYDTFATEDGSKRIELPVKICGDDPNYLTATDVYTLQVKFISSDRKFAQELSINFTLIPADAKAKAALQVRKDCYISSTGYNPYYINWNIENKPKAKPGSTMQIVGTLYRWGYPADFEKISIVKSTLNPRTEQIVGAGTTDANGKFSISFKVDDKNYPSFNFVTEERLKPVGPFYGKFEHSSFPIFMDCSSKFCTYKRMDSLYAPWEGLPKKSDGSCAVAKHEYSLASANPSISISGSNDSDRSKWLFEVKVVKNSLIDPAILAYKQTSAFFNDISASSNSLYIGGIGGSGGSVWVSGHMRNGHYVHGYSRRKG